MEVDIDILRNEQGEFLVNEDFKAKLFLFIIEHYLCKFLCFYLHLTPLTTFFYLNTAHPEIFQAIEESAIGDQVFELEQKSEKKFTWQQNLMQKIHRRQRS